MSTFTTYPKIENLHRIPAILDEPDVVVTEKIHGANVRFGWVNDHFCIGGRNEEFGFETSPPSAGMGFVGWIRKTDIPERVEILAESLSTEIIFYGEWHGQGIQKGVQYVNGKDLRIFDVRIKDDLINWDEVTRLAKEVCIKTVPLLYRGAPSRELFDELRIKPSSVAHENGVGSEENLAEGVVIKPSTMHRDEYGNWLMAKHKNPIWEERKSLKENKPKLEITSGVQEFVDEFFTAERLDHVLTALRESGVNIMASSAIGSVIREMYRDVVKESKEEFTELSKEIKRAIGKLHPSRTKSLLDTYISENNS